MLKFSSPLSFSVALCLVLTATLDAQAEIRLTLQGLTANDEFGAAVGVVGDINGDGKTDVVVGAPFDDPIGLSSGRARVFSGADGSVLLNIPGAAAGQLSGFGVSGAGDVDGDGLPDVLIGMSANGSSGLGPGGGVKICSGADGTVLRLFGGTSAGDGFGISVKDVGDINLDGRGDVIVGAPGSGFGAFAGYARVYSGATGAILYTLTGTAAQERFGFAVSGGEDVNADGVPDFIVGAIGRAAQGPLTGRVYVYSGFTGAVLWTIDGTAAQDQFGHGVDLLGDLDGDGRSEFGVGAYRPTGIGYARVYSGLTGTVMFTFTGVQAEAFGHWVSDAGDTNGDGFRDFVVGAPEADPEGLTNAGRVYIYSGANGSLLRSIRGLTGQRRLGYSVSDAGDVNADGLADVILGTDFVAGIPGLAYVAGTTAAEPYGAGQPGTQPLRLAWIPGIPGQVSAGTLAVSQAAPFTSGAIALSTAAGSSTILGVALHISLTEYLLAFYGHDAMGGAAFFLNLRHPVLAGSSFRAQAFAFDPAAPLGLYGSNGMLLLFSS